MTLSEQLDQILRTGANGEFIVAHFGHPPVYVQAVKLGVSFGLLAQTPDTHQYELTQRAYEVLDEGGFDRWKAALKTRGDQAHFATVDAAKSATSSARAAWLSGIVAVLSLLYSAYLGQQANQLTDDLKKMTARVDTLYWQAKRLPQTPTTSAPLGYRVSSDSAAR